MKLSIEKGMNSKVDSLHASLDKAILDNHTALLTQSENNNKQLQDHIALEVGLLESRVEFLEFGIIGSAKTAKFDPDVAIIVTFHSSVILLFVLVWSGRELGWAVYVCFSMLVFVFGLVWFSIRGRCG